MRGKKRYSAVEGKMVKSVVAQSYCGKLSYVTRKLAATVAAVQRKETGEEIYAYKCDRGCHAWHIGHRNDGWEDAQEARRVRRDA